MFYFPCWNGELCCDVSPSTTRRRRMMALPETNRLIYVLPFSLYFRAMPVDPMDDIELRSVQLQYPNSRGSIVGSCDLRRVPTDKGDILVAVQGDTTKSAIVTYHDLGLNCKLAFVSL